MIEIMIIGDVKAGLTRAKICTNFPPSCQENGKEKWRYKRPYFLELLRCFLNFHGFWTRGLLGEGRGWSLLINVFVV